MLDKKNVPLYIALAVPILMILLVAALVYIPNSFVHPAYSFVYSSGGDYPYDTYVVRDGKLEMRARQPNDPYIQRNSNVPEPKLFVYDPVKNESRELSFEEAKQFKLDPTSKSPDGYEVSQGNSDSGIFGAIFGDSRNYNVRYLTGHGGSKKMNLKAVAGSYYDPYTFRFLGWIGK